MKMDVLITLTDGSKELFIMDAPQKMDIDGIEMELDGQELLDRRVAAKEMPFFAAGVSYEIIAGGSFAPTRAVTPSDYANAIQAVLDQAAIERRYTSGDTMATYVNSTNATWAAEAAAFVKWRDAVWLYAYTQLDAVKAGEIVPPALDVFLASLPTADWPEAS
jgi:hypothetical protein